MSKSFQDRVKEAFERVSANFRESEALSRPLIQSNSVDHANSSRTDNPGERSSADVFTDLEFRQQLMREEEQVLREIAARKHIEEHDRNLARTLELSERDVDQADSPRETVEPSRRRLEDVEVIAKMTIEERQFLSELPQELRAEIVEHKRQMLIQEPRTQTPSETAPRIPPDLPRENPNLDQSKLLKVTVPRGLRAGDKFKVLLPSDTHIIVDVPNGVSGGDTFTITDPDATEPNVLEQETPNVEDLKDDEVAQGKFLDELPPDVRSEILLADPILAQIFTKYSKRKESLTEPKTQEFSFDAFVASPKAPELVSKGEEIKGNDYQAKEEVITEDIATNEKQSDEVEEVEPEADSLLSFTEFSSSPEKNETEKSTAPPKKVEDDPFDFLGLSSDPSFKKEIESPKEDEKDATLETNDIEAETETKPEVEKKKASFEEVEL